MAPTRRKVVFGGMALAGLAASGATALAFRRDLGRARAAVAEGHARMAETRHGPMEYAEAGDGPPFLMLHGTGGGFDQGLLFARRMVGLGYRVIAPSRFGYLGTPMPPGAGPEAEADAMVDLLDHLGLDRVAVAGGSAGAIPALAFAARHPARCSALVPIVPALVIPGRAEVAPWSPARERMVMAALRSDLLFWAAIRLAPAQVTGSILATDPQLVAMAGPEEQARVARIQAHLLPISARADGLIYDNIQTNRPQDIAFEAITAPTLLISAEDDRYLTAQNARYLATRIAGARTLIFADGGHVWAGRDAQLWGAVDAFLRNEAQG